MFDIFGFQTRNKSTLSAIRDKDGDLIYEANQSFEGIQAAMAFRLIGQTKNRPAERGKINIYHF
ncbi:MAG: hypothetical protein CM1200mP28_11320 [Deltaproteobacteria bacterium]|nr:MAG: hypothetical protein CM1200mP28_11320 [Deltaproteobacteria bacterium]